MYVECRCPSFDLLHLLWTRGPRANQPCTVRLFGGGGGRLSPQHVSCWHAKHDVIVGGTTELG